MPVLPRTTLSTRLERHDVLCLQPLGAVGHFELDGGAFGKAAEAAALDGREVNEHVLALLSGDEAEALRVVEPFDGTGLFHGCISFLCCRSELPAAHH